MRNGVFSSALFTAASQPKGWIQGNTKIGPVFEIATCWLHGTYGVKMIERFNSGDLKRIFRNISRTVFIGLTTSGKRAWQEEEETRRDASIVLIHQEQSCTSELFKAIQDAVSLFLRYRCYSEQLFPVH